MRLWVIVALGLAGCDAVTGAVGGGACGPAECAGVCAQGAIGALGGDGGMTAFESALVGPLLEDVRQGVRAWDEQSIGVCQGSGRDCEGFVGVSAPDLPPGEYMVRAELRVPQVGAKGTWKVRFDTECTTVKKTANGESSTTNTSSKDYDVQWTGEERGSRLSPLYKISSPNKNGAQSCTWKLTSLHADHPSEWTGSWSVPQG